MLHGHVPQPLRLALEAIRVWEEPHWRTRRPDAEGFWESRSRSAAAGAVERFVIYLSDGALRYGEGEGVARIQESRDREWRGPIVP